MVQDEVCKGASPYVNISISGCPIQPTSHWHLQLGAICNNIDTGVSRPTHHINQPIKRPSQDGSIGHFTANFTTHVLSFAMVSDGEISLVGI
jgi:hypothetical protein